MGYGMTGRCNGTDGTDDTEQLHSATPDGRRGPRCFASADPNMEDRSVPPGLTHRADADRLVCHRDVLRVGVGRRVDRYRRDPQPLARVDHTAGDLAAVGLKGY